jgi:hemerythrin-like domain-containing protein
MAALKATDELVKDHRMVRKTLEGFRLDNPRFPEIAKTLERILRAHAWFEDTIFLPALKAEPFFARVFMDEISQEHKDLESLMKLIQETRREERERLEFYSRELRSILETHFTKEEDTLFPLSEKILREEGLDRLAQEIRRRQPEAQNFVGKN